VLIMISGLAATPALLSASRTAFGLVGLATGEIIDFTKSRSGPTARALGSGYFEGGLHSVGC